MAWSKVNNEHKKPIGWWYHKILCELYWLYNGQTKYTMYHYHLDKLCSYGFNLYGDKI